VAFETLFYLSVWTMTLFSAFTAVVGASAQTVASDVF
jgi:hypothetical protein